MKKTLGILILLIGAIATFWIIKGTSMDETFGLTGFTESNTAIIQWFVIRFLPLVSFVILALPAGIFYIRQKEKLNKIQKVATWFFSLSILFLFIGFIPILLCVTGISCKGEGFGEFILLGLSASFALGIYMLGFLLLVISWFRK